MRVKCQTALLKNQKVYFSEITQLEEIKPEPKPVSFIKAIQAFANGKTIRCEWEGIGKHTSSIYKDGNMYCFITDEYDHAPCPAEILHGTWYILD